MRKLLLCMLFSMTCFLAGATEQLRDKVVVEGETWEMLSAPLSLLDEVTYDAFKEILGQRQVVSSANWRGYVAYWHIGRKGLYLDKVEVMQPGGKYKEADRKVLRKVMRKYRCLGKIKAKWLTGNVSIAQGQEKKTIVIKKGKVLAIGE